MISIIVPVYNAVNKLSVLVDSIFFTNLQRLRSAISR